MCSLSTAFSVVLYWTHCTSHLQTASGDPLRYGKRMMKLGSNLSVYLSVWLVHVLWCGGSDLIYVWVVSETLYCTVEPLIYRGGGHSWLKGCPRLRGSFVHSSYICMYNIGCQWQTGSVQIREVPVFLFWRSLIEIYHCTCMYVRMCHSLAPIVVRVFWKFSCKETFVG